MATISRYLRYQIITITTGKGPGQFVKEVLVFVEFATLIGRSSLVRKYLIIHLLPIDHIANRKTS